MVKSIVKQIVAWEVIYYPETKSKSRVEEWLNDLTKEQFKSVTKEIELLKLYGNQLSMPHSRPLKGGLFELRERRHNLRIYYCFHGNKIIVLLLGGDKGSQTTDIESARVKMQQLNTKTERQRYETKKL